MHVCLGSRLRGNDEPWVTECPLHTIRVEVRLGLRYPMAMDSRHSPVAINDPLTREGSLECLSRDYNTVRLAIRFLSEQATNQPDLDALAGHLKLSPAHTQKLFKRWCGLSPKEFVQAITLDSARRMLVAAASVLETAHDVGLSGGSRLHDLCVTHEALTPGDIKRRGAGLTLAYGFHATPFGLALAAQSGRGLVALAFVDEERHGSPADALGELQARWPLARWVDEPGASAPSVMGLFGPAGTAVPIRLVLIGTDFEVRTWQALLNVPVGRAVSYADIARAIHCPKASRAVGSAVGRNPLAFVVPCHRVLRGDGGLGGYHWNVTRKQAIIGWEAGVLAGSIGGAL
jgi:AraC family transcriptional regulator, regulatory protein of adaptative response / methylated-DNA-[protein]-cysteine methyltransferase